MNSYKKIRLFSTFGILCWALLFTLMEQTTYARSFRVNMFPNANVNSCANCHINPRGAGPRTPFGEDVFAITGRGNASFWSDTLAAMDSDGDGVTNGQELGINPDGSPAGGQRITNPGDATDFPDIPDPEPISTTLFIQAEGKDLTLTWEEGGTLESADSPLGPWSPVEGAMSPFQTTAEGPTKFYRVGDGSGGQTFTVSLSGSQEVPAVSTGAQGSGTVSIDGNTLSIHVKYEGLESDFAAAHIHGPAGKGVNAGVLFGLSGTDLHQPIDSNSGMFTGSAEVSDATVQAIMAGEAYINIHTSGNGGGEIRGQITP